MSTTSARHCYYANESFYDRDRRGYFVAKVTADQPGYEQTTVISRTAETTKLLADRLNTRLGLSRDDVLDIVASSMRVSVIR